MAGMINDVLLPDDVRSYIREHKIDQTMTAVLNSVVKEMPKDPLEYMVCELARHSASPPSFLELRRDGAAPAEELRFDLLVAVRGVRVRIHSVAMGGALFAKDGAPPEAPEHELSIKELLARKVRHRNEETQAVSFLEGFFAKAFGGLAVDDFLGLHERCQGLAAAPCPRGASVDLRRATAALTEALLVAAARTSNLSRLEYMQLQLVKAGAPTSPALRAPRDFQTWRGRWPRLALPVFHGGGPSVLRAPSLRCCVALSPFAVGSAAEFAGAAGSDCPPLAWASSVVRVLRSAAAEALKLLQGEKATVALAAEGVAYGHPAGLAKTLDLTQEALRRAAAGCVTEACGVLIACAGEVWVESESVYEMEAGKKLTLEQLVDLYAQLSQSGWLRMIVQPFRPEDFSVGCGLLRAQRPDLRLVLDFRDEEPPRNAPQGAAYSCALRLADSVPRTLRRYAELAPSWQEAGGCAVCVQLDAHAAAAMPSALDVAMVCQAEVVCLVPQVAEADLARISERSDETLYSALFPGDDGGAVQ